MDVGVLQFFGKAFSEREHVRFARVIHRHARARQKCGGTRNVEDGAGVALDHRRKQASREFSERRDVHLDHVQLCVDRQRRNGTAGAESSVVDECVHVKASCAQRGAQHTRGSRIAEVCRKDRDGCVVFTFAALRDGGECIDSSCDEHEVKAIGGGAFGEISTDAAGCAGYERDWF